MRAPRRVAALLCLALLGCGDERVAGPEESPAPAARAAVRAGDLASLSPNERTQARRTLAAWLDCEECIDGELDAVLALGADVAVPTLIATLLEGPSPATRALLSLELRARHRELREQAAADPGTSFEQRQSDYVAIYLENAVARYQARSAHALGRFGGPEAERALRKALAGDLRLDAEQEVRSALDAIAGR